LSRERFDLSLDLSHDQNYLVIANSKFGIPLDLSWETCDLSPDTFQLFPDKNHNNMSLETIDEMSRETNHMSLDRQPVII
jgi:hypothetical protein